MRSVRERPSGCVTENPSSSTTILRTPNPLRAFEPRMEMPMSRGPFPCLKETPGLSCSRSSTVKAGESLMRSPLTVVMVCPGGFGSAPGPPSEPAGPCDAAGSAGCAAAGAAAGGGLAGREKSATTRRGEGVVGAGGAVVARFGRGADTTTSGTPTAAGACSAGGLASAGEGADGSASGFGASFDSAAGADGSCDRPGAGTSTAAIRSAANGNIGRCSRAGIGGLPNAVIARTAAVVHFTADNVSKHRLNDMIRSRTAASAAHVSEKLNVMSREDFESSRGPGRSALSGSAEDGNAQRGPTLILVRGRMKRDDAYVALQRRVRNPHRTADRNAMAGRQDRTRRFCHGAEYARRLNKRLVVRQVLRIGRA